LISVVDSSVTVKWYAAESDSPHARRLIGCPLVAPDLIRAEVANALWKKLRLGQMAMSQAALALPHLSRTVTLLPSEAFAEEALELSSALGHPVYDCFFLLVARTLDFPLITADKKLWARTRDTELEGRVIGLADWSDNNG
jgi:predicted nucleic acid-binding protein